ncbi:Ctr copper transporter [Aureobasidium subglaciale]|nr:Ctr copper transporter [Aureobasidium subglaciale]
MSHSMSMGGGSSSECKISMLWNWYTVDACFLASTWHIRTTGMFAASCVGVSLLVVCLEFLRRLGKEYDSYILRQFQRRVASLQYLPRVSHIAPKFDDERNPSGCGPDASCAPPLPEQKYITFRATPVQQVTRGIIHAATFGVGYMVMLLAMYFNGYIIISIVIGAFLGKVLCDWMVVRLPLVMDQSLDDSRGEEAGISEPTVCCG